MFNSSQVLHEYWMVLRNHVSAIDELGMATERLRVRLPDEPKPKLLHIIEPHEVGFQIIHIFIINEMFTLNLYLYNTYCTIHTLKKENLSCMPEVTKRVLQHSYFRIE